MYQRRKIPGLAICNRRRVRSGGRDKVIFDAYASGGYSLKEIGDQIALLPDELNWTRNEDLTPYSSPVRVHAVKAANIAFT